MEKAAGLAVVPGEFGWNDVGSWQSAWELGSPDAAGNSLSAGALAIDAKNNLVRTLGTGKKVVALVGVNDLVVVETEDALLVIPRDRAQDVRLDRRRAQGRRSHRSPLNALFSSVPEACTQPREGAVDVRPRRGDLSRGRRAGDARRAGSAEPELGA